MQAGKNYEDQCTASLKPRECVVRTKLSKKIVKVLWSTICIRSEEIFEINRKVCMFCGDDDLVDTLYAITDGSTQDKIKSAAEYKQDVAELSSFRLGDLFT